MIYWLYKVLALLPLPIKYGLAWVAAILLQRVFRYRAKVIDTNLKNAFPERDAAWRADIAKSCLLYTSTSPRDVEVSRMPSSA